MPHDGHAAFSGNFYDKKLHDGHAAFSGNFYDKKHNFWHKTITKVAVLKAFNAEKSSLF